MIILKGLIIIFISLFSNEVLNQQLCDSGEEGCVTFDECLSQSPSNIVVYNCSDSSKVCCPDYKLQNTLNRGETFNSSPPVHSVNYQIPKKDIPSDNKPADKLISKSGYLLEDRLAGDEVSKTEDSNNGPPDISSHPHLKLLPEICGNSEKERVFGGVMANIMEFRWMVILVYEVQNTLGKRSEKIFGCGGTIISDRYILTAAHCLKDVSGKNVKKLSAVRVGEYDTSSNEDCFSRACLTAKDYAIEEQLPHLGYQGEKRVFQHDIGLIRLKEPIDWDDDETYPRAICLPITRELWFLEQQGEITGWGLIEPKTKGSILTRGVVKIIPNTMCNYMLSLIDESLYVTIRQLCTYDEELSSSCRGDSGGPLQMRQKGRYMQHGIISFGGSHCDGKSPSVYTRIIFYMKWILDNMRP